MCVYNFIVITFLFLHGSLNILSFRFVFSSFMSSNSIIPPVSEMAELHSHDIGAFIFSPLMHIILLLSQAFIIALGSPEKASTIWME